MKIFVDSANLLEIEEALDRGFPAGITTNPSILAKEEKGDFREHIKKIIELVQRYGYDIPLSVEVFSTKREEMITQAEDFVGHFGHYRNINVKIPVGWDELAVIRELRSRNIRVNCTCCMSYNQAVMAAAAGANYVSIFYGRIRDIGYDAAAVVRQVRADVPGAPLPLRDHRGQHPPHRGYQRGPPGGRGHHHGAAQVLPPDGEPSQDRRSGESVHHRLQEVAGVSSRLDPLTSARPSETLARAIEGHLACPRCHGAVTVRVRTRFAAREAAAGSLARSPTGSRSCGNSATGRSSTTSTR